MARLAQHLDQRTRDLQFALNRLITVGDRADDDHARPVAGPYQLLAQQRRQPVLGNDHRLEVQPRRQPEVAVRRPRVAVAAAMLAAAVGIDGMVEGDVGRIVGHDGAARVLPAHLGLRLGRLTLQGVIPGLPAIVERGACIALEAVRHPRGRAAALQGGQREGELGHGVNAPRHMARNCTVHPAPCNGSKASQAGTSGRVS